MKVLNETHSNALIQSVKSVSLILLTSLLFACQGETSAESPAVSPEPVAEAVKEVSKPAVKAVEKVAEPVSSAVETVKEEMAKPVEAHSAPATPRAPADFSKLNPSTYKAVAETIPVSSGEDIEVTELFWFGCGHCYDLERPLKSWLKNKPANAKFKKVPAVFSKRWEFHAKAFYTMEALNVPQEAYDAFFRQLHVTKIGINNSDDLAKFLARFDKDKELVENTLSSFAVDSQFRNAVKITKASGARGVPAMIVDGKYLTSQSDAGGTPEMFDVIDKLVAKSASEK